MNLDDLFHTKEPEEVIESCREMWDLSGRFPRPKFKPICPVCGTTTFRDIQLSRMMFSHQPEKGCPYTADIYFKCRHCSFGPAGFHFGVKIPERMYEENNREARNNRYEWRTIRDYWQSKGVIEADD